MKIKISRNLQLLLLFVLSLTNLIVIIITKPISAYIIIELVLFTIAALITIRYSYALAKFSNKWYSFFNRKNYDSNYDEPSLYAVGIGKLIGYLVLATQIYFLLAF